MNFRKNLPAILASVLLLGTGAYFLKESLSEWWYLYMQSRVIRLNFTGPKTYGNNKPYKGDKIYVNGYIPNFMSWGTFCDPSIDTNPSPTELECEVRLPKGSTLIGQISMVVADAPDRMIHFGDLSYNDYGGRGSTLGSLEVYADGEPLSSQLIQAPSWSDPNPKTTGERGELRTFNFTIQL